MPDSITKTQRWLDLLAFLIGRKLPVTVEQIMEGVPAYAADWTSGDDTARDSVRRKFERDKDELRAIGIPLETISYTVLGEAAEGYRLAREDFYLPYLKLVRATRGSAEPPVDAKSGESAESGVGEEGRPAEAEPGPRTRGGSRQAGASELELTPPEAGAALDALSMAESLPHYPYAAEARTAFYKLSGDFDLERFRRPPVLHLDSSRTGEIGPALRDLAESLDARKRVAFRYHGIHRDEETEREVEPYGLVFQGGHWYLVGHDRLRDDVRTFRVSRMRDLTPNAAKPHTPDYAIPDDFDLEERLGREAWELGPADEGEVATRVRFRFPLSLWAARNRYGELEREHPDGSSVRRFRVRQVHPFLRWVLTFEGDAEILEPSELRDGLRTMARQVAELHESNGGGADDG